MGENYRYYLHEKYDFDKGTWVASGLAIWVIGGVLGFIYETIFYWANTDFNTLYWPSGTFGPWLDSFCIISLILYILMYRLRRKPLLVIPLCAIICTAFQFLIGICLYFFFDGARAWNCSLEILNFGNIGGFICARTFVEFAVLGTLIMYVFVPLILEMACALRRNTFVRLWFIIGFICIADIVYNDVICILIPALPGASDVYASFGFKFMKF